ncbi:MAG: CIA30 family protein [Verrucomicrobia bacterium]|nr:CIA30 family protein [Verrucomicrobiota bacterium]
MNSMRRPQATLLSTVLVIGAIAVTGCRPDHTKEAAATPLLLDDYSDAKRNRNRAERLLIDDQSAGSQSRATVKCADGVLSVHGDLVPGRGVPAFISAVSLLSEEGKPKDMTDYQGVRLRVKVLKGTLCVQVATSTVTNFDYHASAPIAGKGGDFQEVRIPFKAMKRAWSEQTALNLETVTSVNLVSFGLSRDAFAYEVDEIGFY